MAHLFHPPHHLSGANNLSQYCTSMVPEYQENNPHLPCGVWVLPPRNLERPSGMWSLLLLLPPQTRGRECVIQPRPWNYVSFPHPHYEGHGYWQTSKHQRIHHDQPIIFPLHYPILHQQLNFSWWQTHMGQTALWNLQILHLQDQQVLP